MARAAVSRIVRTVLPKMTRAVVLAAIVGAAMGALVPLSIKWFTDSSLAAMACLHSSEVSVYELDVGARNVIEAEGHTQDHNRLSRRR